jgi:hypothetical protein
MRDHSSVHRWRRGDCARMSHRRLRDVQREDGHGRPATVRNYVERGFREVSRERIHLDHDGGFVRVTCREIVISRGIGDCTGDARPLPTWVRASTMRAFEVPTGGHAHSAMTTRPLVGAVRAGHGAANLEDAVGIDL